MSDFKNVTIIKEANVYYDGRVTSRTVLFDSGCRKTLGIMLPGDYEFNTGDPELMEILSGELEVLLPGKTDWQNVKGGESFEVPGNSLFKLKIISVTDYCCSFIG